MVRLYREEPVVKEYLGLVRLSAAERAHDAGRHDHIDKKRGEGVSKTLSAISMKRPSVAARWSRTTRVGAGGDGGCPTRR